MHTYGEVEANDKRIGEVAKELNVSETNINIILGKMGAKIAVKHVPALLVYLYRKNVIQ